MDRFVRRKSEQRSDTFSETYSLPYKELFGRVKTYIVMTDLSLAMQIISNVTAFFIHEGNSIVAKCSIQIEKKKHLNGMTRVRD